MVEENVTSSISAIRRLNSAGAMKTISATADLSRSHYFQHEDFNALDADSCSCYWIKTTCIGRNTPTGNQGECGGDAKKFKDGKN